MTSDHGAPAQEDPATDLWDPDGPPWAGSDLGLLEGLATTRAIRRLLPDPVPERDLVRMLWFATRAPSGSNIQPCRFLVLRDTAESLAGRAILGRVAAERWAIQAPGYGYDRATGRAARMGASMERFVAGVADAPLIVLVTADSGPDHEWQPTDGGSVFPAVQNLLLAARALGYGGVVSQWPRFAADELREALSIPQEVYIFAMVVMGRPEGSHGPVRRAPLNRLVYQGKWGHAPAWAIDPPGTRFSGGPK